MPIIAPDSARGSEWVSRVEARTNSRISVSSRERQRPMIPARIAGPFPAERTPLRSGGHPNHDLTSDRAVANPTPAGRRSNHQRSRRASDFANADASSGCSISASAVSHICSVSSLTMPRPLMNRCCNGAPPNNRTARRGDSPSRGKPSASPTAIPRTKPLNQSTICGEFRFAEEGHLDITSLTSCSTKDNTATLVSMPEQELFRREGDPEEVFDDSAFSAAGGGRGP